MDSTFFVLPEQDRTGRGFAGLGEYADAGHEAQAELVDLVFQGVDGRITVTDGDGAHGLALFIGARSLFQSDVHLRIHDQQARAQRGQHVLGRVILKNH